MHMGPVLANDSFPPINCHIFLHWQQTTTQFSHSNHWIGPIRARTNPSMVFRRGPRTRPGGVDRIVSSIHHSPLINKMWHNWCSAASPFSLFITGIFPNQAQTTSPMVCWWRRCTRLGTRTTTGRAICKSCMPPWTSRRHAVSALRQKLAII